MPTNCPEIDKEAVSLSPNKLINPSAEMGLSGWESALTEVVTGGTEGTNTFKILTGGLMAQSVEPLRDKCLEGFLVKAKYLPPVADYAIDVEATVRVIARYDDGTSELFESPLEENPFAPEQPLPLFDPTTAETLYQVDLLWAEFETEFFTKDDVSLVSIDFYVFNNSTVPMYIDQLEFIDMYTEKYPLFTQLPDTPASYEESAGKLVAVNADENALEFIDKPKRWIESYLRGDVPVGVAIDKRLIPSNLIFETLMLDLDTAPTGGNLLIDVKANGVSILAESLVIAEGETSLTSNDFTKSFIVAGEKLTVDIIETGSTHPGTNLAMNIVCREI